MCGCLPAATIISYHGVTYNLKIDLDPIRSVIAAAISFLGYFVSVNKIYLGLINVRS
jgi:hypothetical protein